jgi:hypothetical protein
MNHGEALVRDMIQDLDARIKFLNIAQDKGTLGPRVVRARLRWLHEDYDKLCIVARRYGFNV